MTLVIQQNDVGEFIREPMPLDRRRRRLSTIAARHRIKGRPCIVSVHRKNSLYAPVDETVKLRKDWKKTLIGKDDVVVITYLPLGGGGSSQQRGGKNIGAALAMLLMTIFVPMGVAMIPGLGAVGGGLTMAGKIVSMGIIAGLGYLISKATQPKANKEEEKKTFGVSGGGNVARAGDRIPVNYGHTWTQPDLTQPDYFSYTEVGGPNDPDDQVLYKRMCLGLGKYRIDTIKVGEAVAWTRTGGLQAPFDKMEMEFIEPGQTSTLVPSAVHSSPNVNGVDMPYGDDPVPWIGPYPVTEPGERATHVQLDWSWPQGYFANTAKRGRVDHEALGIYFQIIQIDDDGNQIGDYSDLYVSTFRGQASAAVRMTKLIAIDKTKRWAVRCRSATPRTTQEQLDRGISHVDTLYWDGLRGHMGKEPARPHTTEIAMKISANAMGSTMTFNDIWVEAVKILPVYANGTWTEQPTRKAIWAAADAIRNGVYGGAVNDLKFDTLTYKHYADEVTLFDTFDGQIRGPISVFEAVSTILGVMRAEPVVMGDYWTLTRDEPRQYSKHVITRREIVKETSVVDFDLDMTTGESDVILEYFSDCDPKRRNEIRETIGARTITPRRIQGFGISDVRHARHIAKWFAATAYYRREARNLTTEKQGRIFQRNEAALIDTWFLNATKASGIEEISDTTLYLDDEIEVAEGDYAIVRTKRGRNWGPVRVTQGADGSSVVLNADDVASMNSYTGQALSTILSNRSRKHRPVSIMIGPLAETQQGYLIRSARQISLDRVEITALNDAPEVWTVLGEDIPDEPPIGGWVDTSVKTPVLPWVNASIVQLALTLSLQWAVGRAQNVDKYQVQIAYGAEGGTNGSAYTTIYDGPLTEGNTPVTFGPDMVDTTVRVRARCINRLGVPSAWMYTTTNLFLPQVNPDLADLEVTIEALSDQLKYEIGLISGTGEGSLADLRENVTNLIDQLGDAQATHVAQTFQKTETIKATQAADKAEIFAALQVERLARADADEVLAQEIDSIVASGGDAAAALVATERTARIAADEVLGQQITDVFASLTADISGEASLRQALTTRVTNVEGQVQADSTLLQNLNTTVNGHSSTLTVLGQSVNGQSLQFGVVGNIDGVTGGFLLTGVRRLDGTVTYDMKISANLFVDGSITGRHLAGNSLIISGRAQVGSLVIGTDQIIDGSISNMLSAQGNNPRVTVRVRGKVAIFARGVSGSIRIRGSNPAQYAVMRNGVTIGYIPRSTSVDFDGDTAYITATWREVGMLIDAPADGTYTYECALTGIVSSTPVAQILVMEMAK